MEPDLKYIFRYFQKRPSLHYSVTHRHIGLYIGRMEYSVYVQYYSKFRCWFFPGSRNYYSSLLPVIELVLNKRSSRV